MIFVVDLGMTCTCKYFQQRSVPWMYAITIIDALQHNPVDFVHSSYFVAENISMYSDNILLVPSDFPVYSSPMAPPVARRRGRRSKRRKVWESDQLDRK